MKSAFKSVLIALGVCVASFTAHAQESDKYFAVNAYFVEPDEDRLATDEGFGGDFLFGWNLAGSLFMEARIFSSIFETGVSGGADFYNAGVGLDLQVLLGRRGDFSAFALLGGGFSYNDASPNTFDGGVGMVNAGVGILSRGLTSSKVRLRFDARAVHEDYADGVVDLRYGIGLEIPIDPVEREIREVVVEKVVGHTEVKNYPPRPVDRDNDGVLDNFDRCPDSLPNARVDQAGCVVEVQTFNLEGVNFAEDSDRLTEDSRDVLDQAVDALLGQPDMKVLIAGHTDSVGDDAYNLRLSLGRAAAVKRYLTSSGIAANRLKVVGFGETEPLTSNDTEAGRAQNRRVEMRVEAQE